MGQIKYSFKKWLKLQFDIWNLILQENLRIETIVLHTKTYFKSKYQIETPNPMCIYQLNITILASSLFDI